MVCQVTPDSGHNLSMPEVVRFRAPPEGPLKGVFTMSTTSLSLCLCCYVRCPKDPFGRCTHCGAKRSRKDPFLSLNAATQPPTTSDAIHAELSGR